MRVYLEGFLSDSHPEKYTPELWQGHLWAFQSILSTSPNWSHALLVPNMGWRTGGRWLAHCLRNEVPLLVALHSLNTHTHKHPHTHTTSGMPTHHLPLSPFPPLPSSMLSSPAVLIHRPSQELSYPSGQARLQLRGERDGGVERRKRRKGKMGRLRRRDEGVRCG